MTPSLTSRYTQTRQSWFVVVFVAVMTAGVFVRFRYLWRHHLWNDELSTMRVVSLPWSETLQYLRSVEPHPPLSFLALKVIDSAFAGLLTPDLLKFAVVGWFVVLGVCMLGFVERYRWLAIPMSAGFALVAVNPLFAYLGSEVRPYSLLILVAVCLLLLAAHWVIIGESGGAPGRRVQIGMVVLLAAAAWTQYAGVLLSISLVMAVEVLSLARGRGWDLTLLRVSAVAGAFFLPSMFFIPSQLRIDVSTATTPYSEVTRYLGWGVGGLGVCLAVLAVLGAVALGRPNRRAGQASEQSLTVVVGLFALAATALFLALTVAVAEVTGIQFVNIGVSVVPAFMLTVGLACVATAGLPRTTVILSTALVVVSFPLALTITDSPFLFRGNRVSTVDVLIDVAAVIGYENRAGDSTMVISLDNPVSLDYLEDQASRLYPALIVEPVRVTDNESLGDVLADALSDPTISQVVVITRHSFEHRVVPYLPAESRVIRVHRYAWLVESSSPVLDATVRTAADRSAPAFVMRLG